MNLLQKIDNTRSAWALLMPNISVPTDTWLAKWCAGYGEDAIERAILRTSRKFRDGGAPELAHRYCSATLRHLATEGKKDIMNNDTTPTPEQTAANIEAAHANTPNHFREFAEEMLRSGEITTESTFADARAAIERRHQR